MVGEDTVGDLEPNALRVLHGTTGKAFTRRLDGRERLDWGQKRLDVRFREVQRHPPSLSRAS